MQLHICIHAVDKPETDVHSVMEKTLEEDS